MTTKDLATRIRRRAFRMASRPAAARKLLRLADEAETIEGVDTRQYTGH